MYLEINDIVPISQARARLTALADDVVTNGRHKMFTRNGESYVALVGAHELQELEQYRSAQRMADLRALEDGLEDIKAGRVWTVEEFKPQMAQLRRRVQKMVRLAA